MNTDLLFDFIVDRENNKIVVHREFDADLGLVWEAWTNPKLLVQWIAPKPWRAEIKIMDFREGGFFHYAMISPQDEKHWSRYDYLKIEPQKSILELRGFSDENGTVNSNFPPTECLNVFSETNGKTCVTVTTLYGNADVLEYMVTHGFKEVVSASLENFDTLLGQLKTKSSNENL